MVQASRTSSNLCEPHRVEFFNTSSGWFGSNELPLTTALQGKQGVEGAYALVCGGSSMLEGGGEGGREGA